MRRSMLYLPIAALVPLVAVVGTESAARAGSRTLETFPLSQVHRGQTGYGLTTMQGTTPERFEFEVIGVAHNFLPKMDIILVKSDDKKMAVTGFWQGMSGSPLFIDGKLACAFSYGFRFNKLAIGGCTPIQYMKSEGFRPPRRAAAEAYRRGNRAARSDRAGRGGGATRAGRAAGTTTGTGTGARGATPTGARTGGVGSAPHAWRLTPRARSSHASRAEWLDVAPGGRLGAALDHLAPPREPWVLRAPLPPTPIGPAAGGGAAGAESGTGMVAAAVPMALSGFSAPAFDEAKKLMANYPVEPMQAGGTGNANAGPSDFRIGSPIAVQLVRGDMSAAATGTVSFVEGDGVLAFGHPLFQAGELYAPVAAAEIHTVIPSAQSAFIVSSPLRELGTLVQDRQSTIAADTALATKMIPVDVYIDAGDHGHEQKGQFHVEVLNNRFFTAALSGIATMNAVGLYLPDRDRVTAIMTSKVWIKGYQPLEFRDYLYSSSGAAGVVDGARGLRVLVPLLMNPFAPVDVQRVELRIKLRWQANYGDIRSIRLPAAELQPGKKTYVDVKLTRFDGTPVVDRVPFYVPAGLAGSIVKLEVTAGDSAKLDAAPPQNLDDLVAAFRKLLPGTVYAVTLYSADEGAAINGTLVRDLPSSALDKLHTGASIPRVDVYRAIARSTSPASRVINGKQSVLVKIADKKQ